MKRFGWAAIACVLAMAGPAGTAWAGWSQSAIEVDGKSAGCLWHRSGPGDGKMAIFFDRRAFALVFKSGSLPKKGAYIQEADLSFDQDRQSPDRIETWADGLVAAIWPHERAPFRKLLEAKVVDLTLRSAVNDFTVIVEMDGIRGVLEAVEGCQVDLTAIATDPAGHLDRINKALVGKPKPVTASPSTASKPDQMEPEAKAPAVVPTTPGAPIVEKSTPAAVPTQPMNPRELARAAQTELVRLGCYRGRVDGDWGRGSRRALAQYVRYSKSGSTELSDQLVEALKGESGRICPLVCGVRQVARGNRCVAKTCPSGQKLDRRGRCRDSARSETKKTSPAKPKSTARNKGCGRVAEGAYCLAGTSSNRGTAKIKKCSGGKLTFAFYARDANAFVRYRRCR